MNEVPHALDIRREGERGGVGRGTWGGGGKESARGTDSLWEASFRSFRSFRSLFYVWTKFKVMRHVPCLRLLSNLVPFLPKGHEITKLRT